ncbi:LuxR C-terminal-related transcriptional regulator [Mycobacterium sp. 852014-50255_SCH5639931]|uniref:LuxR C-terminal-related transcriptional regulator n=1 Tax=Mycobacterium sp. 852014-50255_SCH5639931 TaxID=1834112 RepID=UPI0008022859|nr:LuxR C-terminal-related transcriptional regulator [Mycobacterium sp. 852014-50255_SCH5639931]OBB67197.1 transcriptional regulator [Mycobacterium sp. 852014-50255_SCH5639931]
MLANMIDIHSSADTPLLDWSEQSVSELPTGTVTLLLADVEGSTRLWETQSDAMTTALEQLNQTVNNLVADHGGVRPVEQGEGDSFVVAFARPSDAVACALQLQLAVLPPIRIRIGLHTGEVQLRDAGNYAGPTINRTARLRDLAHGGQTVLSGATEPLVLDRLPADAWLTDLGVHPLRDLPRPERIVQLNHPGLTNDFPPLRGANDVANGHLPTQLTSFVGRGTQISDIGQILRDNRLATLTGAGGVGKTRLAVQVAEQVADAFPGGAWFVDLAPVTNPLVVPVTLARTLGLADQPGRSTMETVSKFVRDRKMLLVLDNCEHLLDASAALVVALLDAGRDVTVLATSREPIGVAGELTWRVPSLSVDGEALELFVDRARRTRPDFQRTEDNSFTIAEICRRLDGMPLAIELAAARTRTLSLTQIVDSLHHNFRLLAGGARNAVRRQQTLRASIDWSHAMLTEPERILFRRLAVFMGGFDLDAAHAVGAGTDVEQFQLIDLLGLLVDKSLIVTEEIDGMMRYRLLETVRQYGLEKLAESGEAEAVRIRHRDHYTGAAVALQARMRGDGTPLVPWAELEMANLRAAHSWSCDAGEFEPALQLVSALQRLWVTRARFREGVAGFEAVFGDERYRDADVAPGVWARAVADAGLLAVWFSAPFSLQRAEEALAAARQLDDQELVVHTLLTCGMLAMNDAELVGSYFAEAADLARATGDRAALYHVRAYQCFVGNVSGDPVPSQAAGEEGRALADALGDSFMSRYSRVFLSGALALQGKLAEALQVSNWLVEEARAAEDLPMETFGLMTLAQALAFTGDAAAARAAAQAALENGAAMGGFHEDTAYLALANAALASGDFAAAKQACDAAWGHTSDLKELFVRSLVPTAEATMACGDLVAARRWADETVASVPGCHQVKALTARASIATAQGELQQAERDLHAAIESAEGTGRYLQIPDTLERLAALATEANPEHAARLLGAAHGMRQRHGEVRFEVFQADFDAALAQVRETLGPKPFDTAWSEGSALSTAEAISYAQRGRGARGRPASGWESLTPTELDVVRLVGEGLPNKDIAARLFVSPRTVQSHLTHVYTKLAVSSRVQLAQEAARHG